MSRWLLALMVFGAVSFTATTARADACPEGQVNIGFLDGHVGAELCVPAGDGMQDVVPEESVGSESS